MDKMAIIMIAMINIKMIHDDDPGGGTDIDVTVIQIFTLASVWASQLGSVFPCDTLTECPFSTLRQQDS